jgi:hypothetical protein
MPPITTVILSVPLTLPLSLVNDIESESRRQGVSIPEMLSSMLVDACEERQQAQINDAAAAGLMDFSSVPRFFENGSKAAVDSGPALPAPDAAP